MSRRRTSSDCDRSPGFGNIYQDLAAHQRTEHWHGRDLLNELQQWSDRFCVAFKLDVPDLVLRVDTLPMSVLGHYRPSHNGFGLKGEIALNAQYFCDRPDWQLLGTLLHQCLHAWQHAHGRPSRGDHHNLEFRRKAAELGLLIDRRGVTEYRIEGPFVELLQTNGVDVPFDVAGMDDPDFVAGHQRGRLLRGISRVAGKSKLKKWSCQCTTVRCATQLNARCQVCGEEFRIP